ncbi:unnamed protein product [Prorocentrum cordatum]|uniref:Phosphoglycolate phosphatase n=1 Tax=Prorocentrum cordatum TaxID=2364126 RepID=A0ABN9VBE8_9DINO|nr:unnamed protein product [Polarella glacialis]
MAARLADSGAHVDEVLVAVRGHRLKPGPAMVLEALEGGRCRPSEAVLVGDKLSDLQAAAAAGVRSALVTCSQHGEAAARRLAGGGAGGDVAAAPVHEDLAAVVEAMLGPLPSPLREQKP